MTNAAGNRVDSEKNLKNLKRICKEPAKNLKRTLQFTPTPEIEAEETAGNA